MVGKDAYAADGSSPYYCDGEQFFNRSDGSPAFHFAASEIDRGSLSDTDSMPDRAWVEHLKALHKIGSKEPSKDPFWRAIEQEMGAKTKDHPPAQVAAALENMRVKAMAMKAERESRDMPSILRWLARHWWRRP
jgi:hypothetical protein